MMFVTVFDEKSKEKMLKYGFDYIETMSNPYIFIVEDKSLLDELEIKCVISNTLYF